MHKIFCNGSDLMWFLHCNDFFTFQSSKIKVLLIFFVILHEWQDNRVYQKNQTFPGTNWIGLRLIYFNGLSRLCPGLGPGPWVSKNMFFFVCCSISSRKKIRCPAKIKLKTKTTFFQFCDTFFVSTYKSELLFSNFSRREMALQGYLRRANEAWDSYDGNSLSSLLSFTDNHVRNPKLQVRKVFGFPFS